LRRAEKRYQDGFKDFEKRSVDVTTVSKPVEAHAIGDTAAWAIGQWLKRLLVRTMQLKRFTAARLFWPNVTAMHGNGCC
jgi:hypothetical protein